MVTRICLDAGPINLYYQKNPSVEIKDLMKSIQSKKLIAYVPEVVLVEAYKHLCVAFGNEIAENSIRSFQYYVQPNLVPLSIDLILKAGRYKCRYRNKLSYNDSILIAITLNLKAELHTTEKDLPKIQHLKVVSYEF